MTYNETMNELEKIESLKEKILVQFQRDEISAEEEESSNRALSERAKEAIFAGSEFTEMPNGKEVFDYMWEHLSLFAIIIWTNYFVIIGCVRECTSNIREADEEYTFADSFL